MQQHCIGIAAFFISLTAAWAKPPTNLYWGDTHQHTGNSFDVFLFGTPNATPDIAYRFAKGLPVVNPTTGTRWQLSVPLDFLVVADHAEALGTVQQLLLALLGTAEGGGR